MKLSPNDATGKNSKKIGVIIRKTRCQFGTPNMHSHPVPQRHLYRLLQCRLTERCERPPYHMFQITHISKLVITFEWNAKIEQFEKLYDGIEAVLNIKSFILIIINTKV